MISMSNNLSVTVGKVAEPRFKPWFVLLQSLQIQKLKKKLRFQPRWRNNDATNFIMYTGEKQS